MFDTKSKIPAAAEALKGRADRMPVPPKHHVLNATIDGPYPAGTAKAMRDCRLAAAKGGVISVIGIPHEDIALPMKHIVLNEIEIIGDRANPNTAQDALSLLVNGGIDLTPRPLGTVASGILHNEEVRIGHGR